MLWDGIFLMLIISFFLASFSPFCLLSPLFSLLSSPLPKNLPLSTPKSHSVLPHFFFPLPLEYRAIHFSAPLLSVSGKVEEALLRSYAKWFRYNRYQIFAVS